MIHVAQNLPARPTLTRRGETSDGPRPGGPTVSDMSICLSPRCDGPVIVESITDGHCAHCGLHHRRRTGSVKWDRVVGPVTVTLSGATARTRTPPGYEERIDADAVRFKDKVSIDLTRGTTRFITTIPATRLVRIVARD
jgi:hypothetical protein